MVSMSSGVMLLVLRVAHCALDRLLNMCRCLLSGEDVGPAGCGPAWGNGGARLAPGDDRRDYGLLEDLEDVMPLGAQAIGQRWAGTVIDEQFMIPSP